MLLHALTNESPRSSGGLVDSNWQRLLRCGLRLGVLAAEALDAPCGIHELLLARKERVATRTDFHVDVALVGRAGREV